ncbi:TlpA disulfide reductase family protein [Danxiaibacter flavus]|uniref:TlpA disulfide reductase family protein n=1 Tax=Danxiaibacter flavus TaxID=3049108 RepID=A0ABV3ZM80_9BACT|nr:TlpA disulfide reductase family protein [Chitinophagaceae bacterium DXS]
MKSLKNIFSYFPALKTASKPVQVGEKAPNIIFKNMLNVPKKRLALEELKDKPVIIVFWQRTCTACLNSMHVLAQLQAQYAWRIIFILCTDDTTAHIEWFLRRRKQLRELALPMCVDMGGRIKKYFPHVQLPHVVWIGEGRRVKAITSVEHLTQANIVELLTTNRLRLPVKQDALHFNVNRSFAENGVAANEGAFYESHLTGHLPGVASQRGYYTDDQYSRIYAVNVSKASLYAIAYRYEEHLHEAQLPVRTVFEEEQDRLHIFPQTNDVFPDHTESLLSYELLLPPQKGFEAEYCAHKLMQKDLDRYFNCTSKMAGLLRDCYEVVPRQQQDPEPSASSYQEETVSEMIFYNRPVSNVINYVCDSFTTPLPLVCDDKTNRMTIRLKKQYDDWTALHKDLTDAGLMLQVAQRHINMLVFSSSQEAPAP